MRKRIGAIFAALLVSSAAHAESVMMSADWANGMCKAWNADATLTQALMDSGWVKNNKGRGFKVMQIYREDCADSPRIELRVAEKDGKATCIYGGKAESKLDSDADYLMWADTPRWTEMGRGDYGPMRAMFFRRLRFDGPMNEAMSNMGPFESFLLLVGKVPGQTNACPQK
jgi:putative sterol carrier protein